MFAKKKVRVKFLRAIGYATGDVYNPGDVVELEPELARAVIAYGTAEATDCEVGRAVSLTPPHECWRCHGSGLAFGEPRCPHCGAQQL